MSITKDTTWKHGTSGNESVNTDFTSKTMDLDPSFDMEEDEATCFGDGFRAYEATFENATINVKYHYDTTLIGQLAAIKSGRTAVTWEIGPTGTATGEARISGSAILLKINPPLNVGQVIVITANWRVTGAVVFDTFS